MKNNTSMTALVAMALAVFLVSCPSPLSIMAKGTIILNFSGAPRDASRGPEGDDPRLVIKTMLVVVNGPGMDTMTSQPIRYDSTGTSITLSVPAGPDRVVTVSALNTLGASLYRQAQTVRVVAGKELPLSFSLEAVAYSIGFNPNDGSGTMAPQSIAYGSSAALTQNSFTRTGYTFTGWSLTAGGEPEYANQATYTMGAANITLYAKWTLIVISGQYIQGDGSGAGGGGASGAFAGGAGGAGGGGDDTITGTAGNDIIFGDGSGGGKGGRGVGGDNLTAGAGPGGGGKDSIHGGSGNDIIFGDGFGGTIDHEDGGNGGFGGGGGGGSGAFLSASYGGSGGIGAGSGSGFKGSSAILLPGFGNSGGSGTTPGGNSAVTLGSITGTGSPSPYGFGGGGGFGGSSGGSGATQTPNGPGNMGADGNSDEHRYKDSTGSIHAYVLSRLDTILTDYPAYGAGNDILDGGPGSDHLFGLGGNDTFVFELNDAISGNDIDTIWDFNVLGIDTLKLLIGGTPIDETIRDTLIDTQIIDGTDRKIVFSNVADKKVTIVLKKLGRNIVAGDFE